MKKIIAALAAVSALGVATPTFAADLAARPVYTKEAPVYVPPSYDWTGFYIGINGGYDFGRSRTEDIFRDPTVFPAAIVAIQDINFNTSGYEVGGQIGYNWQMASWVVGIESDFQSLGAKGSTTFTCASCLGGANFSQKNDWFGTTRLRGGFLVTPTFLAYVTGGAAYGEIKTNFTLFNTTNSAIFSDSVTKGGFTVGGGLEDMLSSNWLARVEYLYVDYGDIGTGGQILVGNNQHHNSFNSRVYENIVRAAISYKF